MAPKRSSCENNWYSGASSGTKWIGRDQTADWRLWKVKYGLEILKQRRCAWSCAAIGDDTVRDDLQQQTGLFINIFFVEGTIYENEVLWRYEVRGGLEPSSYKWSLTGDSDGGTVWFRLEI